MLILATASSSNSTFRLNIAVFQTDSKIFDRRVLLSLSVAFTSAPVSISSFRISYALLKLVTIIKDNSSRLLFKFALAPALTSVRIHLGLPYFTAFIKVVYPSRLHLFTPTPISQCLCAADINTVNLYDMRKYIQYCSNQLLILSELLHRMAFLHSRQ